MTQPTTKTKLIDHPLEEFFDIQRGSTELEVIERDTDLVEIQEYDKKDVEIEEQFQEVYDSAMDGHDTLAEEVHTVEGKYKARMGEVAVQHLNVALNAASSKAKLKEHKDKLENKGKSSGSHITNNTLIVDDRSALLAELRNRLNGETEDAKDSDGKEDE